MHKYYESDARAVEILNKYLSGKPLKPRRSPGSKKRLLTAKLSVVAIAHLQQLAEHLGYVYNGHGNVSMLLEAIGTGMIELKPVTLVPHSLD